MKKKVLNIFTVNFFIIFVLYNKFLVENYQKSKDSLQKKTCEKYQDDFEEAKHKKLQYVLEQYVNLPKEKKRKK